MQHPLPPERTTQTPIFSCSQIPFFGGQQTHFIKNHPSNKAKTENICIRSSHKDHKGYKGF
jgi:hypothetical protein